VRLRLYKINASAINVVAIWSSLKLLNSKFRLATFKLLSPVLIPLFLSKHRFTFGIIRQVLFSLFIFLLQSKKSYWCYQPSHQLNKGAGGIPVASVAVFSWHYLLQYHYSGMYNVIISFSGVTPATSAVTTSALLKFQNMVLGKCYLTVYACFFFTGGNS